MGLCVVVISKEDFIIPRFCRSDKVFFQLITALGLKMKKASVLPSDEKMKPFLFIFLNNGKKYAIIYLSYFYHDLF